MRTEASDILDALLELCEPSHPDYLSVSFTDGVLDFLEDLRTQREEHGVLVLTDKQTSWLRAIRRDVQQQIKVATFFERATFEDERAPQ